MQILFQSDNGDVYRLQLCRIDDLVVLKVADGRKVTADLSSLTSELSANESYPETAFGEVSIGSVADVTKLPTTRLLARVVRESVLGP